jgi:hypothetical protein
LAASLQTPIGFITASVPAGTAANPSPYKARDLLELSDIYINGSPIGVVGGPAVHLVAYVGDADGNGAYSSSDALLITRVTLQTDSGFAAYPLVDPVIVADTDGSGFIPADAALQANEAGVGVPTASLALPPVPPGVVIPSLAVSRSTPVTRSTAHSLVTIDFDPTIVSEAGDISPWLLVRRYSNWSLQRRAGGLQPSAIGADPRLAQPLVYHG